MARTIAMRLGHLVRGAYAFVALLLPIVGVPWVMVAIVGWPALARLHHGLATQFLLDALACVVWFAWCAITLAIGEEVYAMIRHTPARRIPFIGAFQPLVAHLLGVVVLVSFAFGSAQPSAASVQTPPTVPLTATVVTHVENPETSTITGASESDTSSPDDAGAPVGYTVVENDSLWSIARTQLGNPLRWPEIFALNEGRSQPDGRTLSDPSLIYPGWQLALPPAEPSSDLTPSTSATPAESASNTTVTTSPYPPARPLVAPPSGSSPATSPTHTDPHAEPALETPSTGAPIPLPSGSLIAPSFAAGILATVTLGRLRRRRRYKPSEPRPGRDLRPPSSSPTLRTLTEERAGMTGPRSEAALLDRFVKDASSVGVLEVGTRHGELASLELTRWGTVNLVGPGAHDPSLGDSNVHAILRAWCAALLAGGERRFSEVLTTAEVFDNLFPALNPVPALRIAASPDGLLRAVEAEILNRARVLDEADVPNARAYRDVRPEDPLPFLLVVAAQVLQTQRDRWRAIAGGGARLGISVLAIESGVGWGAQIIVDADCVVTAASPADLDQQLRHFTLFSLNAPEATELLRIVNAQSTDAEEDEPSDATVPSRGPNEWVDDDWPIDDQNLTTRSARPINVRLLGPYQISAHGAEVTSGLRTAAKELLAWYLLRPEGASAEAAVDGLWPDTMPDLVTKRFWRALGDLRTRLRNDDAGAKVNLLVRSGNHYHVNGEEISCDLWEFQDQLTDAARADDEVATVVALRSAVDLFKGDFVSDVDYLWAEPVREDLHRRALDAHLRLAELEEASGRADAAADVLGRAVRLDRYAEEVFRRLMALQGRMGNKDAITATWAQLQRNLVELGLDPEPSTARLYQTLRHDSEGPSSKPDQLPRR